jgi:glucosamine 6-phosphate synthetase-like amidotransferase/phosphosugar isomerase protein
MIFNKLKTGFLVVILFSFTIALKGQTASKPCTEIWEIECQKATYITEVMALWPTTLQYTKELKQLNISQNEMYLAKIDSIKTSNNKAIKKQVRRKNINKIGIVAAFVLALIIK